MPNLSDYNPAIKYGANLDVNVDLADIRDANNNELLELDTVASAVNYTRIANAATGDAPELSAQGDDTNISLQLSATGTGRVVVGDRNTATASQVAAGSNSNVTLSAQRGVITIPGGVRAGSAFVINLTNTKIASGRDLQTSIGRGTNTINTPISVQTEIGSGSAILVISSATTTVTDGTLLVNFVVV